MSRRKQSNPKPLKSEAHEGTQETTEIEKGEEWSDEKEKSPAPPEDPEDSVSPELEEKPRIRLKANLATDPALQTKQPELESNESPGEYLASLQSALVSRGFYLPAEARPAEAVEARQPVFQCPPCGIRFSSLSTLEAHQTYYCSHRANKSNDDEAKSTGGEPSGSQSDVDASEMPSKHQRVHKQYPCAQCSYSADKKVSLNRHMRMHAVSPSPSNSAVANGEGGGDNHQDRYCAECDIRFSSQKTFRAHKTHYCNSRHMIKAVVAAKAASSTSGSSPTSPVEVTSCKTPPSPTISNAPNQPFLALPTNPIIIVPYALFRGASVLPGLSGAPAPDAPCFLLPNGTLQPMTNALNANAQSETTKLAGRAKDTTAKETSSAPLDLSLRKSLDCSDLVIDLGDEQEKENLKRTPSPEKIECVPSLRGSPRLDSPPKRKPEEPAVGGSSPKRSRSSAKGEAGFDVSGSLHPLLMRGSLPLFPPEIQMRLAELPGIAPPVMPQVLVKQGVSKCKDCNIVFCKLENYVIHKKHYCSARGQDEDGSKASGSPPVSPKSTGTTSPAAQYQQLICLACGIKFTSLDNLNAHQAYYCLKRGESEARKCGKCKGVMESGHQCAPSTAFWKCPCCDVISPTASAAQRHMDSHTGVKAYRCTICRYKGNTLRGMRTHIRMHFDKRSPDLQEEKYITYIIEDESSNTIEVNAIPAIPAVPTAAPTEDPSSSPHADPPETAHLCSHCSYSSTFKANVLRHIKLVHNPPKEEQTTNGEDKGKHMPALEEEEEILVKKEAIEPEVIIAQGEDAIIKEEVDTASSTARSGAKYCKSCDIYFNYYSTFIAHKKFYCSSHAGEITVANANNNNQTSRAPEETSVL